MHQPTNQLTQQLKPGLTRTETFVVAEQHTAYHIGSGDERVLGTPWMISFMELAVVMSVCWAHRG